MTKRILILGGSGFLGSELVRASKGFETYFTYNSSLIKNRNAFSLDLNNIDNFKSILKKTTPNIIVFCARFEDSEKFKQIISLIKNVKFVFMSSDAVFDGKKGNYSEKGTPNPLTTYGIKKKEFEDIIKKELDDYIIIRSSYILGKGEKRSAEIIHALKSNEKLRRFNDMYRNPIYVKDLVKIILNLIENNFRGIINTGGEVIITPFSFAKIVANSKNLDKKLIIPVSYRDFENKSLISPDTTLDITKLKSVINFKLKRIDEINF
ncbi:MAG: sugar nucleotide-binding protein [Candidatus Nanoarchaeia archaeon]|nr:sugar nucleotide-binding protein [Candidatus Nanoarchaeia archaeon]